MSAGIVPIAHANDGGGSIRIPASCCGVYGLKTSRGLVPMGPARGEGWGGLAVEGIISRSVRDTAAALDAIAGFEPGAPYAAPMPRSPFITALGRRVDRPLQIASCVTAWDSIVIDPDCIDAVRRTVTLLRSLGHEVVEGPPPAIDYAKLIDALIVVLAANVTATVNSFVKGLPMEAWAHQLEPSYLDAYQMGGKLSAEQYLSAITTFHSVGRRLERFLENFDLLLTPTLATPPAKLGVIDSTDDFRSFRLKISRYTPFLPMINASGQPAATLPVHWNAEGLPIGVQLVGHFGRDDLVLQISDQLESILRWTEKRPPLQGYLPGHAHDA